MRALLICLFLLPLAHAGSADDPEVTDGSGDSVSSIDFLGAVGADILKGWYEEADTEVLFRFEIGTLCADTAETIEYRWTATANGADVAFGADLFGSGGFCTLAGPETSISPTGATAAASMSGNVATLTMPKSAFGGTTLTGTFGTSSAYVGSPMVWNDADRAPDAGGGRDFSWGDAVVEEPRRLFVNVTDAVLVHETQAEEPLTAGHDLAWNAPVNTTLRWQMAGNGSVDVRVLGPDGEEIAACACTDGANETLDIQTGGTWNIRVDYTDFTGSFTLRAQETEAVQESPGTMTSTTASNTSTPTATEAPANGTSQPTSGEPVEESPALPLAAVLLALVAVARRRA